MDDREDDGAGGTPRIDLGVPWGDKAKTTRQDAGRKHEAKLLKRLGLRAHPGSGSGKIQFDGSDTETLYEVKLAGKSFTMTGDYLMRLFQQAARQSKTAHMSVYFDTLDLTAEISIHRGEPHEQRRDDDG